MGWKGTVRSVRAAVREAERNATSRQRELERRRKQLDKLAAEEQARLEVEEYENYVERLVTLHQEGGQEMDWEALAVQPEPSRPQLGRAAEDAARAALAAYRPNLLDRLLGRREKRIAELRVALDLAPAIDRQEHDLALREWEAHHVEWKKSCELAAKVLDGRAEAWLSVVRDLRPCAEIMELGSRLQFEVVDDHPLHVIVHVHGEELIPKQAKQILRSGRSTEKPLPKGRYYELYQDHVCSALFRVAREMLALLPIELVVVTAMDELLDQRTGRLADQAILSAAIPRSTFESLNLARIDPSEALHNFLHRMDFRKTSGFKPIEPLDPRQVPTRRR